MESQERIVDVEDRPDLTSSLRQNDRTNRRNRTLTVSFREPQPIPITKSQYLTLVLMSFVNFTSNVSFTILASFFDENASQHGLGKSQTGLIVAIYAGIAMIMSPIFGIYLEKIGQKFLLVSGLITAATCSGLFSLLDQVADSDMYFALGLLLRSVQAFGSAGYFTAGYSILVNEWKGSRLSMALGFYELFTGLGMIAGPLLGSALFTAGGYSLPFYFVAALLAGAAILNGILLESSEPSTADYEIFHSPMPDEEPERSSEFHSSSRSHYSTDTYSDQEPKYILKLMTNGLFMIASIIMLPVWGCMDFGMPFIGPHLEDTGVTDNKITVGLLFMGMALGYAGCSVIWGQLCARYRCSRAFMICGSMGASISYLFIGPSPWLAQIGILIEPSLAQTGGVMIFLGMSLSMAIIPSCSELIEASRRERVQDEATNFISGWMNSVVFLGEFLGPFIGGYFIEFGQNDFSLGASYFAAMCGLVTLLCGLGYAILFAKRKWMRKDETPEETYIRQNQRTRRMRRRRMRSSMSFSAGPRALSESMTASLRMQWHDLDDE